MPDHSVEVGKPAPASKPGPVLTGSVDVLTRAFAVSHLSSSLGALLESREAINL